MLEGSQWKGDGLDGHYWRSVSSGCMVWWIGKWGNLPWESFEGHSMAKRQACCVKERILVSTRWSKLPHYRTMFVIFAIETWKLNHLATRNIIGLHIRQTFHHWTILFEANLRNMWRRRSPRTYMWSPSARQQIFREHRWRSFEKNGAAQQKTSRSLYWFTRWLLRAVTVCIYIYIYINK